MKSKFNFFVLMTMLLLAFSACSEDEPEPKQEVLEIKLAEDIPADPDAQQGTTQSYTFYSLREDRIIEKSDSASTQWDIALAGTSILVNGGTSGPGEGAAQVVEGVFEDFTEAPAGGYQQDSQETPAITGWYNYTGQTGTPAHAILAIPGKIIILKTAEGEYAKMEIISYYQGNPDTSTSEFADTNKRPPSRYYTFRYVVQKNGDRNF